jgi:hypothetical protein
MDSNSKHARDFVSKIDPHQPANQPTNQSISPPSLFAPDLPFDRRSKKSLSGIRNYTYSSCDVDRERTHNNKPLHFVHLYLIVIVVIRFVVLDNKKQTLALIQFS